MKGVVFGNRLLGRSSGIHIYICIYIYIDAMYMHFHAYMLPGHISIAEALFGVRTTPNLLVPQDAAGGLADALRAAGPQTLHLSLKILSCSCNTAGYPDVPKGKLNPSLADLLKHLSKTSCTIAEAEFHSQGTGA